MMGNCKASFGQIHNKYVSEEIINGVLPKDKAGTHFCYGQPTIKFIFSLWKFTVFRTKIHPFFVAFYTAKVYLFYREVWDCVPSPEQRSAAGSFAGKFCLCPEGSRCAERGHYEGVF